MKKDSIELTSIEFFETGQQRWFYFTDRTERPVLCPPVGRMRRGREEGRRAGRGRLCSAVAGTQTPCSPAVFGGPALHRSASHSEVSVLEVRLIMAVFEKKSVELTGS